MKQRVEFLVDPLPKPRMTQRDVWKKRPVVEKYYRYKDMMKWEAKRNKFQCGDVLGFEFHIPMPQSWSKKKRAEMIGRPHQQKPDLDNLIKAVKDALLTEDSHIWKYIEEPQKIWSEKGKIILITE